jgi:D-alanine-D-alanine ligase
VITDNRLGDRGDSRIFVEVTRDHMRIGLAYNEKPDSAAAADKPPSTCDAYVEWDEPSTIDAVARALAPLGEVIRLEADVLFPQKLALARPDIVFNMAEGLHGPSREAHVPAICEYFAVPYTGSDPLTLAIALHKARAKEILAFRGVATAPFAVVERVVELSRVRLPFPLFVKPVAEGSSKGIFANNLCDTAEQLRDRVLALLHEYRQPVLVETYLPGPEFTVAILGNGADARCLPLVGIDFTALPAGAPPVYGYEAKWVWDTLERPLAIFACPARVPDELARRIEQVALDAYHAVGCRDWCRVDVRLDEYRIPNVVELNPLPGVIPDPRMNSCFPKAARVAGLSYDELIRSVVDIAWRRITGADAVRRTPQAAIA